MLPKNLKQISLFLERLPGIGEKTANRLAFYLLRLPEEDLKDFAQSIRELKQKTKLCRICFNLTEDNICSICSDQERDTSVITVVEEVIDLLSFETGNIYQGIYHVLHGRIDPLNHITADDIRIKELISKIQNPKFKVKEIILATNPDMEGEATAMYIKDKLKVISQKLKVTRLGYGLPMGGNVEYADYMTLKRALENRSIF